jgi:hypothetical protein
MADGVIGSWTARFSGERQVTFWHYVESQIEDRLVTYCGRQLHRKTPKGILLVQEAPGFDQCGNCPYVAGDPAEALG